MIPCSSIKFSRDQIGYDLRRNESISEDYNKMFSTNMYAKEAMKIIEEHDKSKPMFLYLAFMALHTPFVGVPPKKFRLMISNKARQDTFEESTHDLRDMVLASVDQAIDKVIVKLKETGIYNNSVILVTTDNGGGERFV